MTRDDPRPRFRVRRGDPDDPRPGTSEPGALRRRPRPAPAVPGRPKSPPRRRATAEGAPDPFDPRSSGWGRTSRLDLGVKKILITVPVRKPPKEHFVRTHHDRDSWLETR